MPVLKAVLFTRNSCFPKPTLHVDLEEEPVITENNKQEGSLQNVEARFSLGTFPTASSGPSRCLQAALHFLQWANVSLSASHLQVFAAIHLLHNYIEQMYRCPSFPVVTIKNISRSCLIFPRGQSHPWLRITRAQDNTELYPDLMEKTV